jgi:hypothetical protein
MADEFFSQQRSVTAQPSLEDLKDLREKVGEVFSSILTDISQLRMELQPLKSRWHSISSPKTPEAIKEELSLYKHDLEELMRWATGCMHQINKALNETEQKSGQ